MNQSIKLQSQNQYQNISQEQLSSIISYNKRKAERNSNIKAIQQLNTTTIKERKEQTLLFYFLNLIIPVILTGITVLFFLDITQNAELKGLLIIVLVSAGFVFSVVSNLQIAPWKQIIKLYFLIDNLVPVLIAAIIGFYSVVDFLRTGKWFQLGVLVIFPIWVFYFAGNIRVMIAYLKWSRWKVIMFKLIVLICGLGFFYVGFNYMNGAYKISKGYLPQVQQTVKNTIYLFVFGVCDLFFDFYRKLSDFDQSNDLKYQYQFKDCTDDNDRILVKQELHLYQQQLLQQQVYDNLATNLKWNNSIFASQSNAK